MNKSPSPIWYKILKLLQVLFFSFVFCKMRKVFCYESADYPFNDLYSFTAPPPFSNRILIPVISRPLVWFGFSIKDAFFFLEILFTVLLTFELNSILSLLCNKRFANLFSILLYPFLSLVFLLDAELIDARQSSFRYPYDIPAIFFNLAGLKLILQQRWTMLFLLFTIATLNRDSSILIWAMYSVLWIDKIPLKQFLKFSLSLLAIYIFIRHGINVIFGNTASNPTLGVSFKAYDSWIINLNFIFLSDLTSLLYILFKLSFIPIFYVMLQRYIPQKIKPVGTVVWAYFATLLFAGLIYEVRCFSDLIILLYFLIAIGTYSYLTEKDVIIPIPDSNQNNCLVLIYYAFLKHQVFILLAAFTIGFLYINGL